MFGEDEWWRVWDEMYTAILRYCRAPDGFWVSKTLANTGTYRAAS
jgi:hypothetical protein